MGQTVTTTDQWTPGSDNPDVRGPLWLSGGHGESTCVELVGSEIAAFAEQYMAEIRQAMESLCDAGTPSWGEQGRFAHVAGMIDKLDAMAEAHIEGSVVTVEVDIDPFRLLVFRAADEYAAEIGDVFKGEHHEPRLEISRRHMCAMVDLLDVLGWPDSEPTPGAEANTQAARLRAIAEMVR